MTKAYPYQKKGIRKIHHFGGRALLADDMGLGKSYQALGYSYEVQQYPILIICPAMVKWNWEDECKKHFNLRAVVLNGRKVPKRLPLTKAKIVIINYDILHNWYKYLRKLKFAIVVIDETQYIMNRGTIRAKATARIAKRIKKVIGLSGTPMESKPVELYTILHILRPDKFPSFGAYASRYCGPRRRPWGWEFKGATHKEELHDLLIETLMIRRTKAEVLKDLPPKTRVIMPIDCPGMSEYRLAEKEFLTWLKQQRYSKGKIARAMRAEAVVKLGYLKRLAAKLKLGLVKEWIDNFLATTNEKLIVFGIHKSIIADLKEKYNKQCVVIVGGTSNKKRKLFCKQFSTDKRTRLMIGNLEAAGIGWNGVAASTVATIELGWKPGKHMQADDRVHRIGQTKPVFLYYFIARGTIEERILKLLQDKQGTIDAIMDGKAATDFDLVDQLLESYRRKAA